MGAAAVPMMVAGGLLGAYGAKQDAQQRAFELEAEAKDAEQNAIMAREAGRYNAQRQGIIAAKTIGGIRADYAASGVTSDSGSALEVLRESHANAELDRQNILYGADARARNYEARASSARAGARGVRGAGDINAFAALFNTGARIASRE